MWKTRMFIGLLIALFIIALVLLAMGSSNIQTNKDASVLIAGVFTTLFIFSCLGLAIYKPSVACGVCGTTN